MMGFRKYIVTFILSVFSLAAYSQRVTRASGVFRFLPSPLHHKAVKNYASVTCE